MKNCLSVVYNKSCILISISNTEDMWFAMVWQFSTKGSRLWSLVSTSYALLQCTCVCFCLVVICWQNLLPERQKLQDHRYFFIFFSFNSVQMPQLYCRNGKESQFTSMRSPSLTGSLVSFPYAAAVCQCLPTLLVKPDSSLSSNGPFPVQYLAFI